MSDPRPAYIFTLHRYFLWTDRMRWHFDQVLARGKENNPSWEIETRLYMSYWYGGLFVLIEGWRELKLTDTGVDKLLASPNVPLLKRYRNGAFHFQKDYDADRFLDLITKGENVVSWVRELRDAFSRFFLEWFNAGTATANKPHIPFLKMNNIL